MNSATAVPARTTSAALAAAALLAGCAGMNEAQCRQSNWYDLGYRDARFKLQSQDTLYVQQCERHGARFDAARYDEGFRQGRWDFPDRTPL